MCAAVVRSNDWKFEGCTLHSFAFACGHRPSPVHVFRRRHEMGCGVCSHALHNENEFENRWKRWPCIRLARGHKHCKCTNTFDDRLRSPIVQNCAFQLFCFINGKMTTLVVSKHNIVVVVCRSVWWVCSTPTQYVQFATGRKRLKT